MELFFPNETIELISSYGYFTMFAQSIFFHVKDTKKQSTNDNLSNKFYLNFFPIAMEKKLKTFVLHMHIVQSVSFAPNKAKIQRCCRYVDLCGANKTKRCVIMSSKKKKNASTNNSTINWKTYLLYGQSHAMECRRQQQD